MAIAIDMALANYVGRSSKVQQGPARSSLNMTGRLGPGVDKRVDVMGS